MVVDGDGHVVTTREVTDACQVITVAGLGPADLVAEDKAAHLALLRVYGVRDLVPLPFGQGAGDSFFVQASEVALDAGDKAEWIRCERCTSVSPHNPLLGANCGYCGGAAKINFVEIKWPQPSGRVERFTDVPIDRYGTLVEGKGKVE